jgi:hypothetical protein
VKKQSIRLMLGKSLNLSHSWYLSCFDCFFFHNLTTV